MVITTIRAAIVLLSSLFLQLINYAGLTPPNRPHTSAIPYFLLNNIYSEQKDLYDLSLEAQQIENDYLTVMNLVSPNGVGQKQQNTDGATSPSSFWSTLAKMFSSGETTTPPSEDYSTSYLPKSLEAINTAVTQHMKHHYSNTGYPLLPSDVWFPFSTKTRFISSPGDASPTPTTQLSALRPATPRQVLHQWYRDQRLYQQALVNAWWPLFFTPILAITTTFHTSWLAYLAVGAGVVFGLRAYFEKAAMWYSQLPRATATTPNKRPPNQTKEEFNHAVFYHQFDRTDHSHLTNAHIAKMTQFTTQGALFWFVSLSILLFSIIYPLMFTPWEFFFVYVFLSCLVVSNRLKNLPTPAVWYQYHVDVVEKYLAFCHDNK